MAKVNKAAEGKIVDGIFITRKSFFKTEIEILVGKSEVIYVPKYIEVEKEIEVIKEVEVFKEQPLHAEGKGYGKSRYRGVSWDNRAQKWRAGITHQGKRITIGRFTKELDAARAYDQKAKELQGSKAHLNFYLEVANG